MRHLAAWLTPVGTALILAACSSGHSGSPVIPPKPAPTATINGAVVDGPVSGATMNAYEVTATGTVGTLIGGPVMTSTDGNGTYVLNLNLQTLGGYDGPILLQATNGTYTDAASGQTVNLATTGLTLSALIAPPTQGWSAVGNLSISVTPLSTIAANAGLGMIADGTAAVAAANQVNSAVATYFGALSNLLTTTVLDLTHAGCAASATQPSIDESVVIAAIAQLAASNQVTEPNLLMALIQDVTADGIFDGIGSGATNGGAIYVPLIAGGSIPLSTIEGAHGLATALQASAAAFTTSNANVCKVSESSSLVTALDMPSPPPIVPPKTSYALSGTLNGLPPGIGPQIYLDLLLNSSAADSGTTHFQFFPVAGSFNETFSSLYGAADVSGWTLTINGQPKGYQCTLASPSTGTLNSITNAISSGVVVNCNAPTYTIGGSITGLTAAGLQLSLNGAGALPVAANATTFTFPGLVTGTAYAVSVAANPTGQTCTVSSQSGTVASANVTNVAVTCTAVGGGGGGGGSGGTTPVALNGPNGLALAGDTLYVANYGGNQVIAFSVLYSAAHQVTGLKQVSSITQGLSGPARLAFDTDGNLYVANQGGNNVTIYNTGDALVDTIADSSLNGPLGVAVDSQGDVYVADNASDEVSVFQPKSTVGPSQGYTLVSTFGQDGAGNQFIAPGALLDVNVAMASNYAIQGEFLILGLGPQGIPDHLTVYGASSIASLTYPLLTSSSVPAYNLAGVSGCTAPLGPTGIALFVDAAAPLSSAIYVTSYYDSRVFEYPATDFLLPGGTSCPTPIINSNGINLPEGIVVDSYGNVFVANSANSGTNPNSILVFTGGAAFANAPPSLVFTQ